MADEIACKQGCGKTFDQDGAWRAKHELKCKGKAATEGRIAARDGSPAPIAAKAARTHRKAAKRSKGVAKRAHKMTAPSHDDYGSSRADVIAALKDRRDRITVAIEALESVG